MIAEREGVGPFYNAADDLIERNLKMPSCALGLEEHLHNFLAMGVLENILLKSLTSYLGCNMIEVCVFCDTKLVQTLVVFLVK